ncbi:MAG: hypothetical protein IJ087_01620 [Eggerthellaceae bacterium]|nr:hypothetical protein [Eggerthellaceae bacterium]
MAMTIDLRNYDEVMNNLTNCKKDLAKGTKRVLNDLARRGAKTIVGTEVTKVYNIKKGEVTGASRGYKVVDSIALAGVTIDTYELEWRGRPFTPTHFAMSVLKRGTVKWKPLKASGKIVLKSTTYPQFPVFVAKGLPFTRTPGTRPRKTERGWSGLPIDVVRSHLSVPQMIDNEKVNPNVEREINRRIEEKLNEYLS